MKRRRELVHDFIASTEGILIFLEEESMKSQKSMCGVLLLVLLGLGLATLGMQGQEKSSPATVAVHMVVMVEPLRDSDNTVPPLSREDVKVRQGKNNLQVTGWIPARGDQAGLQLFVLIDDT